MEKKIVFRISRPYKISATEKADAVVLPAVQGNITIIPDRAPTLILLQNGLVQVLDAHNQPTQRFFIKGGVADVARNRCAVSSEKVVAFEKMSIEKAASKRDEAIHQDDKDFYQMVVDTLLMLKS